MTNPISSQQGQPSYRTFDDGFLPPKKRQKCATTEASTEVSSIDSQVEAQKFELLVQAVNEFAQLPDRLPLWPKDEFDEYMTEYMKEHLQDANPHDLDAFIKLHRDRALIEARSPEYSKMAPSEVECFAGIMREAVEQYKKDRGDFYPDRDRLAEKVQDVFNKYGVGHYDQTTYDLALQTTLDDIYGEVVASGQVGDLTSRKRNYRIIRDDDESMSISSSDSEADSLADQIKEGDEEKNTHLVLVEAIKKFKEMPGRLPLWPKLKFNEHIKNCLKNANIDVTTRAFSRGILNKHLDKALAEAKGPAYSTMGSQVHCYLPLMLEAVKAHKEATGGGDDFINREALTSRINDVFKKYKVESPERHALHEARQEALHTIYGKKINLNSREAKVSIDSENAVVEDEESESMSISSVAAENEDNEIEDEERESTCTSFGSREAPLSDQTTAMHANAKTKESDKEKYTLLVEAIKGFKDLMKGLPLWPKLQFNKHVREYFKKNNCSFGTREEFISFMKRHAEDALIDADGPSYATIVSSKVDAYEPLITEVVKKHKAETGVPFRDRAGLTSKVEKVFKEHHVDFPNKSSYYRALNNAISKEYGDVVNLNSSEARSSLDDIYGEVVASGEVADSTSTHAKASIEAPSSKPTTTLQRTKAAIKQDDIEKYTLLVAATKEFKMLPGRLPLWPKKEYYTYVWEYFKNAGRKFDSESFFQRFMKVYLDVALAEAEVPDSLTKSVLTSYVPLMIKAVEEHKANTGVPFRDRAGLLERVKQVFAKYGVVIIPRRNDYFDSLNIALKNAYGYVVKLKEVKDP